MDETRAREILKAIIDELWNTRRRPILGSKLKAALIERTANEHSPFDEKLLGFSSFADFLKRSGVVAVKFREGKDMLIVPIEHSAELEDGMLRDERRPQVRNDFWRAFVTFPLRGQLRAYDPSTDRILWQPPDSISTSAILIEPIARDTQLQWRKDFVRALVKWCVNLSRGDPSL